MANVTYPEISITGILDCYPQRSKRTNDSGADIAYVVINPLENGNDRIPAHFLRAKDYNTAKNDYDRNGKQVSLSDKPGSFCVYLTDPRIALGDCAPGDLVTLTAKVYPVKEAYQSHKDKTKVGVSNISELYFEIVGTIQKATSKKV